LATTSIYCWGLVRGGVLDRMVMCFFLPLLLCSSRIISKLWQLSWILL